MDLRWWSIEVLDGTRSSAARWRESHQETLVSAVIAFGARDWDWRLFRWGVLFETAFADESGWASFRELPAVRAALDAVPDPVNGLLIYPGRGGSAGSLQPRRPRPVTGAGAAEIPREPVRTRVTLAVAEPVPTAGGVTA
ncbi:hypothetical protein [Actinoplanes utahensis]|uniref:Uncharacterized protein n=1 Tax=Actinoplanes utahensis TaxID=1869 RepID=A0A0A6USG1_ACTUT|nr:hypothetical protein [Actinoplanes utahensis]KHD77923.1 hypothetical protein MB27_07220 [Actinoplanes utahensis]